MLQGNRAILGGFVSLADLGIFTIAFTFATIPTMMTFMVDNRVIFPLFRKFHALEDPNGRQKVLKARRLLLLGMTLLAVFFVALSVALVETLYDSRYYAAGPMLTLFGLSMTPMIVRSCYEGAFLALGKSKLQFYLHSLMAAGQVGAALLLIPPFGVLGAILAPGLAALLVYAPTAYVVHRHNAWDPLCDLGLLLLGWGVTAAAILYWWEDVAPLLPL